MGRTLIRKPLRYFLILSCLVFPVVSTQAQETIKVAADSLAADTLVVSVAGMDPTPPAQGIGIEIFKIKSGQSYVFKIGSIVRVKSTNQKGRSRMKRARLTHIVGDEFTFTPINMKYEEVTYTPSTIDYVEFVTPFTFFRGVVVNIVIISAIVVVATILFVETLLTGGTPTTGQSLDWIPFDDFHKHIRFHRAKKDPKWGVRTITVKV